MILLSAGLLALGLADLLRWSPEPVAPRRALGAALASLAVTVAMIAVSGQGLGRVLWVAGLVAAVLGLWIASGSADPISGPLERWYSHLGFGFVGAVPVDQFILGLSAALFATATVNRIVRLALDAAMGSWERSETALAGGRLLGPLERLIIGAIVLAADPAAAAIVIAAKGLLRFPEIRGGSNGVPTPSPSTS
jgi:hypothetical protein